MRCAHSAAYHHYRQSMHKGHMILDIRGHTHGDTWCLCGNANQCVIHALGVRVERCEVFGCRWRAHRLVSLNKTLHTFFPPNLSHSLSPSHLAPWLSETDVKFVAQFQMRLSLSFQVCLSNALGPWGLRRSEPSPGPHGTPCYPACTAAAAVHAGPAAWRRGQQERAGASAWITLSQDGAPTHPTLR